MTDSLSAVNRLINDAAEKPQVEEIYRSANGDVWQLIRTPGNDHVMVRHTANAASGGAVSEMSVHAFLAVNGSGPEHGALRLLMDKN